MLDKAPADSGSRERALIWLFEELQLDEVMVFVAKLVTFLVVCGICSVTTVAVDLLPSQSLSCMMSSTPPCLHSLHIVNPLDFPHTKL